MIFEHAEAELVDALTKISTYQKAISAAYEAEQKEYLRIFALSDKLSPEVVAQIEEIYALTLRNNPNKNAGVIE